MPVPNELAELVDEAYKANEYPIGKYRSRAHYIIEAVRGQLRVEGFLGGEKE